MENQITKFDPNIKVDFTPKIEEINKLVAESAGVTVSDFTNEAQVKLVKDHRIRLRDLITLITKQGKDFRDDATKFSKEVIRIEKELIALVEPERDRLANLEEQAKIVKERNDRLVLLPKRLERLTSIGDDVTISDDLILDMDGPAFEGYFNQRMADKIAKDRIDMEAREKKIKEDEERVAIATAAAEKAERDAKEAAEKAERDAKEAAEKAERDAKEAAEKAERDAKEAAEKKERDERIAKEAVEADAKAKQERVEKDERYKQFLADNGWTKEHEDEFMIGNDVMRNTFTLYKKIASITL